MNKLSVISAFLGGVKNRYMQYHPNRSFRERVEMASRIPGVDGLELCYPADFEEPSETARLMREQGLGVSGINVRTRREGKWLRGGLTSADPAERQEVYDEFRHAMDLSCELGIRRVSTCPLNDGHDYVFETDYFDAYQYAEESFAAICEHDRSVRVCIEYKFNDPRTRCLLGSAGETLSFCHAVGAENLGVTLDFGHAILSGERPAQSAVLLHRAGRLFYVHLNDNDRYWDWDMLPGAFNLLELVEFFYYLKRIGYTDDWYAYDVMAKEVDMTENFETVTWLTRRIEKFADRIDDARIAEILRARNPAASMRYLYETVFQ
jgi:xylose isomerase